ncbi:MAG: hypothetical protein LUG18_11760 [Candidatus Azobacteroides sp.]|nr:hypothetical protein [Candidatus Azobacteroides sp.]
MDTISKRPAWKKYLFISLAVLLLIGAGIFYFQYYFVVATGLKNGQLNYLTHKGYVFKTYEGRLIQVGIRPSATGQGVQSNDFMFSVASKEVAEKMESLTGKELQLHYKEYNRSLPWRGYSKYVVDSIVSVKEPASTGIVPVY